MLLIALGGFDLDSAVGAQEVVAAGILADHEGALTTDVVVGLHAEVHQLHRASSVRGERNAHRGGEVTLILGEAGHDVRVRNVVRLHDGDVSNLHDLAVAVAALTAPVLVQDLRGLSQEVVDRGTASEVTLVVRDVLLVELLSDLEQERREHFAVSCGSCVGEDRAAVLASDDGSLTGSKHEAAGDVHVHCTGEFTTDLAGVNRAHIVVVLRFLDVAQEGVADEQVVDGDDLLSVQDRLTRDFCAGGVI